MDGGLGQHLAVHVDTCELQAVHKGGIVHSVCLAACADAGDPELTEVSLLLLAADICVAAGLHHLLVCHLIVAGLVAPVTLSQAKDLISMFAGHHCALNSCHLSIPPISTSKPYLFVRDHLFDSCFVGNIGHSAGTQTTATLGVLLSEDMALESMSALYLTGLGEIESLLSTAVGLKFGHDIFSFRMLLFRYNL